MRILAPSALLFLLAAPLVAQVPRVVTVTEMKPATLDELARTVVTAPLFRHDEKPRPRTAMKSAADDGAVVADFVAIPEAAFTPAPPAPRGFRAAFDPLPGATTGYAPPDASGAAGLHHVLGAFNNSLTVHDRSGNQLSLLSIYQFWHDELLAKMEVYDPRVMYDAANDRFVLAMLGDVFQRNGVLLVAISATGDPTGTWRRFRLNAGASSGIALDYTRMAMTADQIVITANEFSNDASTGLDIFTIPKSSAYSNSAPLGAVESHVSTLFDLTPVSAADATQRFLLQSDSGSIALYVFNPGRLDRTATYQPPLGFFTGLGECDQLGTSTMIECDDSTLHYAIVRDGVLWVVQSANDASRGEVVVWKIAGSAASGFVLKDAAADYGYPSIAVNRYGGALVGYSTFSAQQYPSAAYRYIDPDGNVSAPATVKSGEDWYSYGRWGDYSSTVVDPLDDTNFWTLQSYSTPPFNGNHSTWGTWWSYVQVKAQPRGRAVRH